MKTFELFNEQQVWHLVSQTSARNQFFSLDERISQDYVAEPLPSHLVSLKALQDRPAYFTGMTWGSKGPELQ